MRHKLKIGGYHLVIYELIFKVKQLIQVTPPHIRTHTSQTTVGSLSSVKLKINLLLPE